MILCFCCCMIVCFFVFFAVCHHSLRGLVQAPTLGGRCKHQLWRNLTKLEDRVLWNPSKRVMSLRRRDIRAQFNATSLFARGRIRCEFTVRTPNSMRLHFSHAARIPNAFVQIDRFWRYACSILCMLIVFGHFRFSKFPNQDRYPLGVSVGELAGVSRKPCRNDAVSAATVFQRAAGGRKCKFQGGSRRSDGRPRATTKSSNFCAHLGAQFPTRSSL